MQYDINRLQRLSQRLHCDTTCAIFATLDIRSSGVDSAIGTFAPDVAHMLEMKEAACYSYAPDATRNSEEKQRLSQRHQIFARLVNLRYLVPQLR